MSKIAVILLTISLVFTAGTVSTSKKEIDATSDFQKQEEVIILEEETEEVSYDENVISYVASIDSEVQIIIEKDAITSEDENILKKHFITITDFIFYNGTIDGITFDELTKEAKQEILNIYTAIDQKIESCCPNYKENIKETSTKIYKTAVETAKELKISLEEKYKEKVGEDKYNQTKEAYEEDKQKLKEAYNNTTDKLKEKATAAKDKFNKWYNNYKNGVEE